MAASSAGIDRYNHALKYLAEHLDDCPEMQCILHTDMLHQNVLISNDRIAGVIDWGNSRFGDFLHELAIFTFYTPWFPAMSAIDWAGEAKRHYRQIGLEVPNFEARMRCYEVHVGLEGMAYCAFVEAWEDLEDHARRTIARISTG